MRLPQPSRALCERLGWPPAGSKGQRSFRRLFAQPAHLPQMLSQLHRLIAQQIISNPAPFSTSSYLDGIAESVPRSDGPNLRNLGQRDFLHASPVQRSPRPPKRAAFRPNFFYAERSPHARRKRENVARQVQRDQRKNISIVVRTSCSEAHEHLGEQAKHNSAETNQQEVLSCKILPVDPDAQVAASHVDMHAPSSVNVEPGFRKIVNDAGDWPVRPRYELACPSFPAFSAGG